MYMGWFAPDTVPIDPVPLCVTGLLPPLTERVAFSDDQSTEAMNENGRVPVSTSVAVVLHNSLRTVAAVSHPFV